MQVYPEEVHVTYIVAYRLVAFCLTVGGTVFSWPGGTSLSGGGCMGVITCTACSIVCTVVISVALIHSSCSLLVGQYILLSAS